MSNAAILPADDGEQQQRQLLLLARAEAEQQRRRIRELEAEVEEQRREIAGLRARLLASEEGGGALATLAKVMTEASAEAEARRSGSGSGGGGADAAASKAALEGAAQSVVKRIGASKNEGDASGGDDDEIEDTEVDASERKRPRRRTKAERANVDAGDDEGKGVGEDDEEEGIAVGAPKKRTRVGRRQSPRRKLITKKKVRAKAAKGGSPTTKRKTRSLPTRKAAQDALLKSQVKGEVTGKRKRGRPRRSPAASPADEDSPERDAVAEEEEEEYYGEEEEEEYYSEEEEEGDGFLRRKKGKRKPGYVPFADIDPERKTEGMIKYEKKLEDNYNARLAELEQFKAENGHCNVPQKYPPNKNLGRFVESIRRYYGRHQKGEHVPVLFVRNLDRLREMGFQLDRTRRSISEANWEKRISQLKQFKEEHGHCIVPPSAHKKFPGLHNFVNNMRVQYRKLKEGQEKVAVLTPRRMAVLNDLGFVFNHRGNRTDRWDENYENLKKFREEHGHSRVTDASDSFLAMWCQTQRVQYRNLMQNKEGKTMMSPDRIAKLQLLGFEWNPLDARATYWEARFRDLLTYKAEHGDMRVPKIYKPNVKLSNWVYEQRKMYRKRREGDKAGTRMTDEKIRRLEEVGFEWTVVSYLRTDRKKEQEGEPEHQVETEEVFGDDEEEDEKRLQHQHQQQQQQELYRAEQHQQLQQQQQQHLQQQLQRQQVQQELRMQAMSEDQQQLQRQQVQQELRIQALREEQAREFGLMEDQHQHPFGHRQHLTVPNEATLHPLPPAIPPHPQYKWP